MELNLTPLQFEVYEKFKQGIIPEQTHDIFSNLIISTDILAYLPINTEKEIIGKKAHLKKMRRLALNKPVGRSILLHIPSGTQAITTDKFIYLPPNVVIYPLGVIKEGEYFGSLQRKIKLSLDSLNIPQGLEKFTICKEFQGGDILPKQDFIALSDSGDKTHQDIAKKIEEHNPDISKDVYKSLSLQDTHDRYKLVQHNIEDLKDGILNGHPFIERETPQEEVLTKSEIIDKIKEIRKAYNYPHFSSDVELEQHIKKNLPLYYKLHKDEIHESAQDAFYFFDVVPDNSSKNKHIRQGEKFEESQEPKRYKIVWSSHYNKNPESLRHFIEGKLKDDFLKVKNSGGKIPLSTQKFYGKVLADIPKAFKPGQEVPASLDSYLRNVIFKDRALGGKYTHVALNKNMDARNQAFIRGHLGDWSSIRLPKSGEEKRNEQELRRIKEMLTPVLYDNKLDSRYDHFLNILHTKFNDYADKLDDLKNSGNTKQIEEEYKNLAEKRNMLGSRIVRMTTGIRPGYNSRSREGGIDLVGSRTLRPIHVRTEGDDKINLKFTGKTSKVHNQTYSDPILNNVIRRTNKQNLDLAQRTYSTLHPGYRTKRVKTPREFHESIPLFFGADNSKREKDLFNQELAPHLEKLGLTPEHIKSMRDYDDRKVIFNKIAHETAKSIAQAHRGKTPNIDDLEDKTFLHASMRTGNRYDTLRNNYVLPGLVHETLRRELEPKGEK